MCEICNSVPLDFFKCPGQSQDPGQHTDHVVKNISYILYLFFSIQPKPTNKRNNKVSQKQVSISVNLRHSSAEDFVEETFYYPH